MPNPMKFFWIYYFYLWHLILLTTLFSRTTFSWYYSTSSLILFLAVFFAGSSSTYPAKVGNPQVPPLTLWFQLIHTYYGLWDLKFDARLLSWTAGLCIYPPVRYITWISFHRHVNSTCPWNSSFSVSPKDQLSIIYLSKCTTYPVISKPV